MRTLGLLLLVCAACAKKPPPKSATPPAPETTQPAEEPKSDSGKSGPQKIGDPCDGGEKPK